MYVLRNALRNISRNVGRNALMGAIVLAVIVTAVVSLMIGQASGLMIDAQKARFGVRVYINPDLSRVSVMSGRQSGQTVPLRDVYAALAGSGCLMGADLACHVPSVSDSLRGLGEGPVGGAVPFSPDGDNSGRFPTMNVKGYTDAQSLDDFRDGMRGLAAGAFPLGDGECIVSEDFAELNGLAVGDVIEVSQGMVAHNPLSLLVVGVYYDFTANMFGAAAEAPAAINVRNDIITTYGTAFAYGKTDPRVDTAAYTLRDPGLLPEFEAEARAAGLSYDYKVTTDEEAYKRAVGPLEGMRGISAAFMVTVLILGSLIIALLATLSIRERRYEVGVLRAMGMRRRTVAYGLVLESLAVTLACLLIGLGVGAAVAQPVTDMLLEGQAAAADTAAEPGAGMYYAGTQGAGAGAEPVSSMDVSLSLGVVAMIASVSVMLVLVSSAAGILRLTKYEPIRLLTDRG